ncbi:hypothetical protein ACWGJ2_33190 [Streptomyces sp. NPDC054796]
MLVLVVLALWVTGHAGDPAWWTAAGSVVTATAAFSMGRPVLRCLHLRLR